MGSRLVPGGRPVISFFSGGVHRPVVSVFVLTGLWVVRKFGDVYPHETVNAHVRRLLDQEFTCSRLSETPAQFRVRMQKAEDHMNSSAFAKKGGGQGLLGLAKELRARCKWVVQNQGERVPK